MHPCLNSWPYLPTYLHAYHRSYLLILPACLQLSPNPTTLCLFFSRCLPTHLSYLLALTHTLTLTARPVLHRAAVPQPPPRLACPFALQLGGAILAEGASTAVLTGVFVTSNEATLFGGGLSFNDGSSCLMADSYVRDNAAGGGGGGGLHFSGATGVLDGVVLSGNSVAAGGCVCVCVLFFCVVGGGV